MTAAGSDTHQSLGRQIEQRAFGGEHGPTPPIAAAFERHPLQIGRRNPIDADGVHALKGAEIDFEAARRLCGRNREQRAASPVRFRVRRVQKQIRHTLSVRVEQSEVRQSAFCNPAVAALNDPETRRIAQQR
jgi:hypothetical protein